MSENPYDSPIDSSEPSQLPKKTNIWVIVFATAAVIAFAVMLLLPASRSARPAARRNQCINNLKNIALAMHNYHDVHGEFPPAYTVDEDGKPLHSWRTLLLPFVEEPELYESIDLTKPWDDPVNAKAFEVGLSIYRCPSIDIPKNQTGYLAIVSPDSCLQPVKSKNFGQITDGTSKTIMIIEVPAEQAVPWMAPTDASLKTFLGLRQAAHQAHNSAAIAAFVDGHVTALVPTSLSEETMRAVPTAAGGEAVSIDE